jgi:hypothetical protein
MKLNADKQKQQESTSGSGPPKKLAIKPYIKGETTLSNKISPQNAQRFGH